MRSSQGSSPSGNCPIATTSLPRSRAPRPASSGRRSCASDTTSEAARLLQVDDEEADQLFEIVRRADDFAADAARAFAIGELDAGDIAHFEVDFDRLMLRMADARALEACAGAKRNGGVGYQGADAVVADVDHLGIEGQRAHAHFAIHRRLRRYRDAVDRPALLDGEHDGR